MRTRIEPIERDIGILIQSDLSPDAQSRALASVARDELEAAKAQNRTVLGREPRFETFVDGRKNAPLEQVRPTGTIVFEFEVLLDLFAWIGEMLVTHSPARSGRYAGSHAFYVDGDLIDPGAPVPEIKTEAVFVNTQPYARKIERGLSPQAPDGVYQVVATMAGRRFGNVARIKFAYRSPLGGALNEWAGKTSLVRRGRRMSAAARAEWLRRQPAIVITMGR